MYIADAIAEDMPGYEPFVYVLSALGASRVSKIFERCEAVKYFSVKPIHPKALANNLIHLLDSTDADNAPFANTSANLDYIIEDYLHKLGVTTALMSARCARVAIEMAMKVDKNKRPDMMGLYADVGKVFVPSLTKNAVERNIRYCIVRVKDAQTPFYKKLPLSSSHKITCFNFIYDSAKYLKNMIEESGNGAILN